MVYSFLLILLSKDVCYTTWLLSSSLGTHNSHLCSMSLIDFGSMVAPSVQFYFTSSFISSYGFHFNLQLGSLFSIYGLFKHNRVGGDEVDHASLDAEQGTYIAPTIGQSADMTNMSKSPDTHEAPHSRQTAGVWGYIFQIIFQVIFLLKFSC